MTQNENRAGRNSGPETKWTIRKMIEKAKEEGRLGVVLTCKDKLVHYYASFGFQNEGVSEASTHGGVTWNQMRLTF